MPATPNVDTARVVLTGATPLVLDNIEHADPEDPIAQAIAKITDMGKDMTAEDRKRKDWLAYNASLYLSAGPDGSRTVVMPWVNINRALRTGAFRIAGTNASGKADGGIASGVLEFPLIHNGPQDPGKLYEDERFRFRKMVNKNPTGKKAMIPTTRPIFPEWSLELTLIVFNEIISWDMFGRVMSATGTAVGLGNARKLGHGRFTAEVTRL
jgi:hypothetical protein